MRLSTYAFVVASVDKVGVANPIIFWLFMLTDPLVGLVEAIELSVELDGNPPPLARTYALVATSWFPTGSRQFVILWLLMSRLAVAFVID